MQSTFSKHRLNRGFTLVEMAIVLVIIGLILAAVSIGKDAQRNADYNRIIQKFLGQWQQAYNEHYERYGVPVGDDPAQPTRQVNGAEGEGSAALGGADLIKAMVDAGIKLPSGDGNNENRYVYLDHNGVPFTLYVDFYYNQTAGNCSGLLGNVMLVRGATPELAKMLDQRIDGILNPNEGVLRVHRPTIAAGGSWADSADEVVTGVSNAGGDYGSIPGYNLCWKMTN